MDDNNDGTYSYTFTLELDGVVSIMIQLMEQPGIYATYFSNINLSGSPSLTQYESNIDHPWNGGSIEGLGSQYISGRFKSVIKAPSNGTFTFHLYHDDGIRVYINNNLMFQNWGNMCLK
jgi:MSHA biogenesis protein MshQ